MSDLWLHIDKDILVSSIRLQIKNGCLKKNDVDWLFICIKQITASEHLIAKEINWLKQFTFDLNFEIRPLLASFENEKEKDEISKVLVEIVKITCGIDGIAEPLVRKCLQKLVEAVTQLEDSFHEKSQEGHLLLCITDVLHLLQIICDSLKTSCLSEFNTDLLKVCNDILTTEWVSQKQFVIANHIISSLLDVSEEEHLSVIISSLQRLHERQDYTNLFLLLAIQLEKLLHSSLIERDFFWRLLQDGLVCSDPLARKRSLYINKCILDVISKKDTFSTQLHDKCDLPIVYWQNEKSGTLWKAWKAFVLVCETLEEKQVHVINPVLPTVNEILEISNEKMFHYSWLLVILQRAVAHESKLIQSWAVKFTLCLDLSKFPLLSQPDHGFIFNVLFESLKNIFLYNNEEGTDPRSSPKLLPLLKGFFQSCFEVLDGHQQLDFCVKILETISDSTFNQIVLVYITMALSSQRLHTKLNEVHIQAFRSFLMNKLPVYSKGFQTIIFHNMSQFFCYNTELSLRNIETFLPLLSNAYTFEIMKFDAKCWSVWKTFYGTLNATYLYEAFQSKICRYMNDTTQIIDVPTSSAEVLVLVQLLNDNGLSVDNALSNVFEIITKLSTNPYLPNEKILKCLQFVDLQLNKNIVDDVHGIILRHINSLLDFIRQRLFSAHEETEVNLNILTCCLNIVAGLVADPSTNSHASLVRFFNNIAKPLLNSLQGLYGTRKVHSVAQYKMLSIGVDIIKKSLPIDDLNSALLSLVTDFNRKDLAKLQSSYNSDAFICSSWTILNSLVNGWSMSNEQAEALFSAFLSDVTMASTDTILTLTNFAKHFVRLFENDDSKLCELVDCLWKITNNYLRDGQCLWAIFSNCIQTILHKNMVCSKSEVIVDKVKESWGIIFDLGERKMAVASFAVEQFFNVWSLNAVAMSSMLNYKDILIKIATFGPIRPKKEKPLHFLFTFLNTCDEYDCIDMLKSFQHHDQQVRVTFTNFLLNLQNTEETNKLVVFLVQEFIQFDQTIIQKCFYINSLVHRQKLRCWQAFLVLLPKLPKDYDFGELLRQLFASCKADNQVSVRYLIEWAIVLILSIDRSLIGKLLGEFDSATEKKIFSVTYILSTLIQLTKSVTNEEFKQLTLKALPSILPWAHAQHMSSRTYSQVALELIWERIKRENHKELLEKFYYLEYFFSLKETNSSSLKHRRELTSKFYISKFDAMKDYNLESMFYTFLKKHAVLADEWINCDQFQLPEVFHTNFPMLTMKLRRADAATEQVTLVPQETKREVGEIYMDTQKKIMPWNLVPTDDLLLQSELSRKKDHGTSELILCAVLVEKIPNLGGLSRTAEIFGVKKLVIGSNRYLSDPSFKSLSVTSEKWLDIQQVIPIKLALYLKEMREEGYTIVGVEQTTNSRMIGEFKFPKKSVLVLGNEKTGIPVDLIQLLDECVEIPQLGIIRSLNVHISGAIMVWEYCKQHSLSSS